MSREQNERKTDVSSKVQLAAAVACLVGPIVTGYFVLTVQDVAAQEDEKHDESPSAHYEEFKSIREEVNTLKLDVAEAKGDMRVIKSDVSTNKETANRIEGKVDQVLEYLLTEGN